MNFIRSLRKKLIPRREISPIQEINSIKFFAFKKKRFYNPTNFSDTSQLVSGYITRE